VKAEGSIKNGNIQGRIVWVGVTVMFTLLIFLQSSMNGTISEKESMGFLNIINSFLIAIRFEKTVTHQMVRKAAHIIEYFILGILHVLATASDSRRVLIKQFPRILLLTMTTALVDETIQLFVPGREGLVSDILLDCMSAFTGIFITSMFVSIAKKSEK